MAVNIPSAKLMEIVKLSERKQALLAQIQEIDRKMLELEREIDRLPGASKGKARLTFSTAPTTETKSGRIRKRDRQRKSRGRSKD